MFRALALRIRSDEELTPETSAFVISVRWPIYIINSVDKTKFLYNALIAVVKPGGLRNSMLLLYDEVLFIQCRNHFLDCFGL